MITKKLLGLVLTLFLLNIFLALNSFGQTIDPCIQSCISAGYSGGGTPIDLAAKQACNTAVTNGTAIWLGTCCCPKSAPIVTSTSSTTSGTTSTTSSGSLSCDAVCTNNSSAYYGGQPSGAACPAGSACIPHTGYPGQYCTCLSCPNNCSLVAAPGCPAGTSVGAPGGSSTNNKACCCPVATPTPTPNSFTCNSTAPQCNGTCPQGQICQGAGYQSIGIICSCVTPTPTPTPPTCGWGGLYGNYCDINGICPPGQKCREHSGNQCGCITPKVCGNGLLESGVLINGIVQDEACDDGAQNGLNGNCTKNCKYVCGARSQSYICADDECPNANEKCTFDSSKNTCSCVAPCGGTAPNCSGYCSPGNTCQSIGLPSIGVICGCAAPTPTPFCGDGMVNNDGTCNPLNEECDDGNIVSGDGCSTNCKIECTDARKVKERIAIQDAFIKVYQNAYSGTMPPLGNNPFGWAQQFYASIFQSASSSDPYVCYYIYKVLGEAVWKELDNGFTKDNGPFKCYRLAKVSGQESLFGANILNHTFFGIVPYDWIPHGSYTDPYLYFVDPWESEHGISILPYPNSDITNHFPTIPWIMPKENLTPQQCTQLGSQGAAFSTCALPSLSAPLCVDSEDAYFKQKAQECCGLTLP